MFFTVYKKLNNSKEK